MPVLKQPTEKDVQDILNCVFTPLKESDTKCLSIDDKLEVLISIQTMILQELRKARETQKCPSCNGKGSVPALYKSSMTNIQCQVCNGKGY